MELPSYVKQPSQETYHQLLNQLLIQGLSNAGWTVPQASAAQIAQLAPSMPLGTFWYNTTSNKLMVQTTAGLETITSAL